ncbi:hypothetical protein [Pseudoalteromonas luteoviolacea]|uniref:hypothetical protein n=1 Tax=Pseudoalteromonas luteoviolacea TaxID=43657 RepID=UPI00115203A0|nr:hypothetical protein [Pseudoalteromonas luteoviolacea]TQF71988.1 hypothetical protein FLM44_13290 [Pseudoalteromonas luteoviolacea]
MHPAVQSAIRSLVSEGKTPTVATVKSKLTAPVPMPVLIAALTAYKNNPEAIESIESSEESVEVNKQTQLDRIEAKLDKLLALLEERA